MSDHETIDLITRAGRALYGPLWEIELARALDVDPRTVRLWGAGVMEPHPDFYGDLIPLLRDKINESHAVLKALKLARLGR